LARKERMLADVCQDKKIAGFGTQSTAMAFFWDPHPGACVNAGVYLGLDLLGPGCNAFAVTERARLTTAARPFAIRARLRELQPSARPHDLTRAFAGRTLNYGAARIAGALAARALFGSVDRDVCSQAFERLFKA